MTDEGAERIIVAWTDQGYQVDVLTSQFGDLAEGEYVLASSATAEVEELKALLRESRCALLAIGDAVAPDDLPSWIDIPYAMIGKIDRLLGKQ